MQFGAGSIGRGFIADLLHDSGYSMTFIDINEKLNEQINQKNKYSLYIIEEKYKKKVIDNVQAYSPITQYQECIHAIVEADIITTSVWADKLSKIAPLLLKGLKQRAIKKKSKINILACENAVANSEQLKNEMQKLDKTFDFEQVAAFPNTAVDRLVLESEREGEKVIDIGKAFELVIEKDKLVDPDLEPVRGAEYTNDLMKFLERKLYIINCGHAWAGYIGHLKGLTIIQEVFRDESLVSEVKQTMLESGNLISEKFGFTMNEIETYIDFAIRRFQTPGITDTIARVSRSPVRKLQSNERLLGPAVQCEERGLKNDLLVRGIAAALLYNDSNDDQSIELQSYIKKYGIEKAILHFTGLKKSSSLFERVVSNYYELAEDFRID